jgi:hypothetical protein
MMDDTTFVGEAADVQQQAALLQDKTSAEQHYKTELLKELTVWCWLWQGSIHEFQP